MFSVEERQERRRKQPLSVPTSWVKDSTTTTAMETAKGCACSVWLE